MRATLKYSLSAFVLGVAISACDNANAADAAAAEELKRDLQLASSTVDLAGGRVDPALLTALETAPKATPAPAKTVRKAQGPRAVRSEAPTVRATPEVEVAAVEEAAVTETVAEAPAPENTEPVAIAPRPQPVVIQTGGAGDYGTGSSGGGVFGGGGIIIRGGGIDGDNCELHDRARRGRTRGPVYIPNTATPVGTRGPVLVPRTSAPTTRVTPTTTGRERVAQTMAARERMRIR